MSKEFRIYRANNAKTGVASKWQLAEKPKEKFVDYMVFLDIAAQAPQDDDNGNARFQWKEKFITVKLEEVDIGKLIATLEGRNGETKIFHESPNGATKTVTLTWHENGYYLKVTSKGKEDKEPLIFKQGLGFEDAAVLGVLLKRAIEVIYGWH